ncbi:hypothetical protein, partial [Glutamicibacter sp. V16R2B1]|uniref:hypothetical protein n=1 Tax=Glutamicibacter sp. V16R2B1 TaxID=2036207 RepID=UPI0014856704
RLNDSAELQVTWDNQALARLERSPQGMVVRELVRRGQLVQDAAQRQVRLGHIGGGPGGRPNLRYTIVKRLVQDGSNDLPTMLIGSESPIALLHHEGSRPHVIVPRRKKVLVFVPRGGGPWVFTKRVRHPGFRGNKYLTDNLPLAAQ